MNKLSIGIATIALVVATGASAADLAPKMYAKAPIIPPVLYDWNGFYIGGNAGYSWGRAKTDGNLTGTQSVSVFRTAGPSLLPGFPVVTTLATLPLTGRANVNGFIGGGQAGYNWQRGTWLFGLEADIQGSDERDSADVCIVAGCAIGTGILTANYKLDWFGTAARPRRFPSDRPRPALRDRRSGVRPPVCEHAADPVELGLDPRRLDRRCRRRGRARPQLVVQGRVPLHGSRQCRRLVAVGDHDHQRAEHAIGRFQHGDDDDDNGGLQQALYR
jgi:hypothetical protein